VSKTFSILFLLLNSLLTNGQTLHFEREVILNYDVHNASIDGEGQIYITSKSGSIYKYSKSGDSLQSYSPRKNAEITLIEAWSGLKIFVFYREFQEYILLDRFLRPSPFYSFDPQYISFAGMATLAIDGNVWVIDPGDFALKKYNSLSNTLEFSSPLDLILPIDDYEVSFMREYQNLLFINDINTGIHIIDNMGNYQKKIPITNVRQIGFIKNHLYFLEENKISLYEIYRGSWNSIQVPFSSENIPEIVIMSAKRAYLLGTNSLLIYILDD